MCVWLLALRRRACRFLGLQIIVHLALFVVVSGVGSFVGSIITVLGASVPLCCMMNERGWQFYIVFQLFAFICYLLDLVLFVILDGLVVLMPIIGVVSNLVGLILAAGALRYFSTSLPTTVEVQLPNEPKPMLATTVGDGDGSDAAAAANSNGSQYVVGVVSAYAAEGDDEESR